MNKAAFLDRDGVLLRAFPEQGKLPAGPRTLDQYEVLPWAKEQCARLKSRGFVLVCVTNQPEIQRGMTDLETQYGINSTLMSDAGIDNVYMCIHDTKDSCSCRKPSPGMFYTAAYVRQIDINSSFSIGDTWRDRQAAESIGLNHYNIDTNRDWSWVVDEILGEKTWHV